MKKPKASITKALNGVDVALAEWQSSIRPYVEADLLERGWSKKEVKDYIEAYNGALLSLHQLFRATRDA